MTTKAKQTTDPDELRMSSEEFDGIMRGVLGGKTTGKSEPREPARRRGPSKKRRTPAKKH